MICRGGIVVGEAGLLERAVPRGRAPCDSGQATSSTETLAAPARTTVAWFRLAMAIALLAAVLAILPGRTHIPPLVESDYCYQLIAANRLHDGLGLTAPPPVAPFQPWEWSTDWTFVTKWPVGYPILVAGLRRIFGLDTIDACRWISLTACAAALVGWFAWLRRCVPNGVTGVVLAALAAGSSVSAAYLVNPSTDAILVGALPYVLLLTNEALGRLRSSGRGTREDARGVIAVGFAALAAGSLVWVRYAAIFVPVAIGCTLVIEAAVYRRLRARHVVAFAVFAALPVAALLVLNRLLGAPAPIQSQLNLGQAAAFDLTWTQLLTAWRHWTDLGFYDYHAAARNAYALWPVAVLLAAVAIPGVRRALRRFVPNPAVGLSAATVVAGLSMLIIVTAVFGRKFDFVGLDRYYTPIKPLYYALFVAPLLLLPRRAARVAVSVVLLVGCSWIVQQEWSRTYGRWLAADREAAPSGQWARAFSPGAAELYTWLRERRSDDLIVVSNYHEYVAFETGIPALPIPPDQDTLTRWVERIRSSRGVSHPAVWFVLDPDNRERGYWIRSPAEIVREFRLQPADAPARGGAARVYEFHPPVADGDA